MRIANESWAPVSRAKRFSCLSKGTFLSLSRQEGREERQRWLERLAPGTQGAPKGGHSVRAHDRKDTRKGGSESTSGLRGNRGPGRRGSSGRGTALTASGPEEHLNLPLDPSPQPGSRATSLGLTGDWEISNCSAFFGIRKKIKIKQ